MIIRELLFSFGKQCRNWKFGPHEFYTTSGRFFFRRLSYSCSDTFYTDLFDGIFRLRTSVRRKTLQKIYHVSNEIENVNHRLATIRQNTVCTRRVFLHVREKRPPIVLYGCTREPYCFVVTHYNNNTAAVRLSVKRYFQTACPRANNIK